MHLLILSRHFSDVMSVSLCICVSLSVCLPACVCVKVSVVSPGVMPAAVSFKELPAVLDSMLQ